MFEYLSPRPGADYVQPGAPLAFRAASTLSHLDIDHLASAVTVRGSATGVHSGSWILARDGRTFIFRPDRPFAPGERVDLSAAVGGSRSSTWSFTVAPRRQVELDALAAVPVDDPFRQVELDARATEPFYNPFPGPVSGPQGSGDVGGLPLPLRFPEFTVTVSDNPAPGVLFLVNKVGRNQTPVYDTYVMILDNSATPLYFKQLDGRGGDFKKQGDVLTYRFGDWHVMDDTYTHVDQWAPAGGLSPDGHDFQLLPNGNAIFATKYNRIVDMSLIVPGGNPAATVIECIIQELDPDRNVVFEWRSWDHYDVTESIVNLTRPTIDYVHFNSIELDHDGNLLISGRYMDCTKINRSTGDIVWRLGGSQNDFTLVGDTDFFNRQHDIRRLDNGNVTIFDNNDGITKGNRVVEYELDEGNMIATLVWQYERTPAIYGGPGGSAQRLPNGNTLISWTGTGIVQEVTPAGATVFEMDYVDGSTQNYRAFRYEWSGVAAAPTVWASEVTNDAVTLHFANWGDPDVSQFHVYQGSSPDPTTRVASTPDQTLQIGNLTGGQVVHFRVTSEDAGAVESPYSDNLEITVKSPPVAVCRDTTVVSAGEPCEAALLPEDIGGGSFDPDDDPLTLILDPPGPYAVGETPVMLVVDDGSAADTCYAVVTVDCPTQVRLGAFDVRRDGDRAVVSWMVAENASGVAFDVYREAGAGRVRLNETSLTGGPSFAFVDEAAPSGGAAYWLAEKGRDGKVTWYGPARLDPAGAPGAFTLSPGRPNPFSDAMTLSFHLPRKEAVHVDIIDIAGRRVATLVSGHLGPGDHVIRWDGRTDNGVRAPAGAYLVRLRHGSELRVQKIVLMR
jgi:hypothetical protein